jgi:hypothetical protein
VLLIPAGGVLITGSAVTASPIELIAVTVMLILLNSSTGVVNALTDPDTDTLVVKKLATHNIVSVSTVIVYMSTMPPPGGCVQFKEIELSMTVRVTDGGNGGSNGGSTASKIVIPIPCLKCKYLIR